MPKHDSVLLYVHRNRAAISPFTQLLNSAPQNAHSHAQITVRPGPQGKHALATIKSALWTFVSPRPVQVEFSQQCLL